METLAYLKYYFNTFYSVLLFYLTAKVLINFSVHIQIHICLTCLSISTLAIADYVQLYYNVLTRKVGSFEMKCGYHKFQVHLRWRNPRNSRFSSYISYWNRLVFNNIYIYYVINSTYLCTHLHAFSWTNEWTIERFTGRHDATARNNPKQWRCHGQCRNYKIAGNFTLIV